MEGEKTEDKGSRERMEIEDGDREKTDKRELS